MSNLNIKGTYKTGKKKVDADISLISFTEDGAVIIYAPALDLSACGTDIQDAKNSFTIALEEFFRYTVNKNTLLGELQKLGWKIKGGKKHPKLSAPDFSTLLNENKTFEDIVENKEFQKFTERVRIPQFA